jgi:prolyl oligopeptidase
MTTLNRRNLLVSASALGLCSLGRSAWGQASGPPVASIRRVTETIFGTTVIDPYRWMENSQDPEWKPYLMGQNAYARRVLASLHGRDELARRIHRNTGLIEPVSTVQLAGPYIFIERRPEGADTFKLYVRNGINGAERLLVDPDDEATGSTHFALDYWKASPDGSLVGFGTSPAGSENSVLQFVETATGKRLLDRLDRALFGPVSWLPDSSAVFINRMRAGTKPGDIDRYLDSAVWLHRIGTDPASDARVLAREMDPVVPMQDIGTPMIAARAGESFMLATVENGTEFELDVYVAPAHSVVEGSPHWTSVCKVADKVTMVTMLHGELYLLSHQNASHFKILRTSAARPSIATAEVVVREGNRILKAIAAARDGLFITATNAGLGELLHLSTDGKTRRLTLPFEGTVSDLRTDPLQDGCWFLLESWVRPRVVCFGKADGSVVVTGLAPKPAIDTAPYGSREVMVTARDGARVPLSIVYRKGVRRDASAPVFLTAYGSYGLTEDPYFSSGLLPVLDLGVVLAVAHVRGGGELGQEWYEAGKLLTKPNTWRDCIDCAEYLIAEKWTSKGKLAVSGTSGGGIMVGRFLTERPDLLAVAIISVGATNALRFEFEESGPLNIPEFGSIKDPVGFKALMEMDAVSHVEDGVAYPAVLLTTGLTDPRVANWEAGKMTARLQAATSSRRPVILRVETDAGHGMGSTRKQKDDESADLCAFILWQTGDHRFQPS